MATLLLDMMFTQVKPKEITTKGCNDISHFHIMHETCSDPVTGHYFSVWLLGQAKQIMKSLSGITDFLCCMWLVVVGDIKM